MPNRCPTDAQKMPKRCPKDAQKMPKRCPTDDWKYAQKIAKVCLKGALGIPTKIISKVFIDSTVFLRKCKNHNSPGIFKCYLKNLKWTKITAPTGTHPGIKWHTILRPSWTSQWGRFEFSTFKLNNMF